MASAAFMECDKEQVQTSAHIPAYAPVIDLEKKDRIAVYMYNIGAAVPTARPWNLIPEVPVDIDAYYIVEGPIWKTFDDHTTGLLEQWRRKGWQVRPVARAKGSNSTSQNRLTSKLTKFTPSPDMLRGHSWVVTFDATVVLDLYKLRAFLEEHTESPLVLLDWRHWTGDYSVTGYRCLVDEMEAIMEDAPHELITTNTSLRNCQRWLSTMRAMRNHVARDNDLFPHYYDLSIMFRNLRHPYDERVQAAFKGVAEISHYMERDRFVMPSFLKVHDLSAEVDLVRIEDLQRELGHCVVASKAPLSPSGGESLLRLAGGNLSKLLGANASKVALLKKPTRNVTLLRRSGDNVSALTKSHGNAPALTKSGRNVKMLRKNPVRSIRLLKHKPGGSASLAKQTKSV